MRPYRPLGERIRCAHILGQRRCGEACGESSEKGSPGNFPLCHAERNFACEEACEKMAYRRFFPKPCGERICVRGMVRGKKKGLPEDIR